MKKRKILLDSLLLILLLAILILPISSVGMLKVKDKSDTKGGVLSITDIRDEVDTSESDSLENFYEKNPTILLDQVLEQSSYTPATPTDPIEEATESISE